MDWWRAVSLETDFVRPFPLSIELVEDGKQVKAL